MARLPLIDPEHTTGKTAELLAEHGRRLGNHPGPMVQAMANSSALLGGYLGLSQAMKRAHLDRRVSELVSLAIQEWIGCEYCLQAHSEGARAAGATEDEITLARRGTSTNGKTAALIAFGLQVLAGPAEIGDSDIDALRDHGWRDEQIADVVGLVALNLLTGAFNLVAGIHPKTRKEIPA